MMTKQDKGQWQRKSNKIVLWNIKNKNGIFPEKQLLKCALFHVEGKSGRPFCSVIITNLRKFFFSVLQLYSCSFLFSDTGEIIQIFLEALLSFGVKFEKLGFASVAKLHWTYVETLPQLTFKANCTRGTRWMWYETSKLKRSRISREGWAVC